MNENAEPNRRPWPAAFMRRLGRILPPKGPPRPAGHDLKGGVGVVGGAHRGGERQGVVMVFHKPLAPPVAPGMTRTPS